MKALVKKESRPGLWLESVPEPAVGLNDVLIRTRKTAICGTDIHIYQWDAWAQKTVPVPLTTGHEFVGAIAAMGSEVRGLSIGQRVSGEGHLTCGHCRNCRAGRRHLCPNTIGLGVQRTGCFAEYLSLPATNVFPLPDAIPDRIAAFLDPLGNAAHTALSFDLVGEDVLITGAGPIGVMATAIARHVGARHIVVTDVNDYRLDLARKLGATAAINTLQESLPETMRKLGLTEGFDVGLEMSGHAEAIRLLLSSMRNGGSLALLGISSGSFEIDWNTIIFRGLHLKGIYGREIFETWYKVAAMLESGLNVEAVLTHSFAAPDYEKAFEVMRTGQSGKVILDWNADAFSGTTQPRG
ncbi:MAG: L-threonine 3-dehydrogenase [Gammaproteobacteria bacterium]